MDKLISKIQELSTFPECGVKVDSRKVAPGDIFIAVKGTVYDGHNFISEAVGKGAVAVIAEYIPESVSPEISSDIIISDDTRISLGILSKYIFRDPSASMDVYGVTGTNGKTTTVFLIDSILNNASVRSGFISTVFIKTCGEKIRKASMTTPDLMDLNRFLHEIAGDNKHSAVVEISSHALAQKRVYGIGLDAAVFTNISPEHLDYHKDMDTYFMDKSLILENLKVEGRVVLNSDDVRVISLKNNKPAGRVITFGIDNKSDVMAEDIKLSPAGTEFTLKVRSGSPFRIRTALIGRHNVYNILAAAAALLDSGLSTEDIIKGIESAGPVPGRLDPVIGNMPFYVFIDYAHTPNALENVLSCARTLAERKLVCVFGCGGDRDRTKRPVMGRIASEICDHVIITNDNPRTEEPGDILGQIENGMAGNDNYSIIEDRKNAISRAMLTAGEGDVIIIAGKGHEDYQIIGKDILDFDDKVIASDILKDMGFDLTLQDQAYDKHGCT